ncbi:hypothetical protein E2C01_099327 [Portunus trituberculatus]|uniref:Uncharacterized protein n=1 Tax=Portunus trituberculatus TaxID=210409 RepID=A0A5B7K9C2_PORTR|nr:hypothetical protein [Portunus trituberculatus]
MIARKMYLWNESGSKWRKRCMRMTEEWITSCMRDENGWEKSK